MRLEEIKQEIRKNGLEVIDYHKTVLSKELKACLSNPETVEAVWVLRRKNNQKSTKEVKV